MSSSVMHQYQDLIKIFNDCFFSNNNTKLIKGDDEPLYLPANQERPYNAIFFAHGYFSSALHECSHWLIAGLSRRKQTDYGYWYVPDGRNALQQKLFERVEVKPQALEWILSKAAGYRFRLSIDNLHGDDSDSDEFMQAIYQQALVYCEKGLPKRANLFRNALCRFYKTAPNLTKEHFDINCLKAYI